jgi:hypothetical protein
MKFYLLSCTTYPTQNFTTSLFWLLHCIIPVSRHPPCVGGHFVLVHRFSFLKAKSTALFDRIQNNTTLFMRFFFFLFLYFSPPINIKTFPFFHFLYHINNFLFTTIQNFFTFLYIFLNFYISSSLFTNSKINNLLFCYVLYRSLSNRPYVPMLVSVSHAPLHRSHWRPSYLPSSAISLSTVHPLELFARSISAVVVF